jgi:energy-coupling factor transporter ATP-binding protein EcfA2
MNRQRGVVVELVGPAGAGKTTLAQGVSAVDPSVRAGLSLWGLPRPRLFEAALPLLPTFVASILLPSRRLQWGEMAQMVRLGALRSVVSDEARKHRVILLDEGPVFALSWLDVFFARNGDRAVSWRRRIVADWASLLDVVVFIDASDSTLAQRIRTREKEHMVKDHSDEEIYGFAAGFRKAFDRVIAEIAKAGHLVVDALRTDRGHEGENADRLMATLQRRRNGN